MAEVQPARSRLEEKLGLVLDSRFYLTAFPNRL
jgi:hypothetical protein